MATGCKGQKGHKNVPRPYRYSECTDECVSKPTQRPTQELRTFYGVLIMPLSLEDCKMKFPAGKPRERDITFAQTELIQTNKYKNSNENEKAQNPKGKASRRQGYFNQVLNHR